MTRPARTGIRADVRVRFPPELAEVIKPELPSLTEEIIAEVRRAIPEYARPMNGPYGRVLRMGVGQALAKMHLAGRDFPIVRANALSVSGWRPLFEQAASRADEVQHGLRAFIGAELDHLEAANVWPNNLPQGVIHADLFPDNVFFLGERLSGIIDFTFACNDMLAYDVAICLNAWCFESDYSFNVTKARAFLNAYSRERELSDAEQHALPLLARGAALRFLLTRLVDCLNVPPGALVRPKDPLEYVRKLRFQQSVASMRDYGVATSGLVA